jgi:hypothetical protein
MKKKVATIILNRNLPEATNNLVEHLQIYDNEETDVYVLEAGSDELMLSKYVSWHAKSVDQMKHGLRYSRGINYALSQLILEGKFDTYEAFFLLTNDTELDKKKTIEPLINILEVHRKVGILSPCSRKWGEVTLLNEEKTKYFWFIHNNAYLIRRSFVEDICDVSKPDTMNFLFDGENFRGYLSEMELIAKAYANDWAAAITSEVFAEENESYLIEKYELIKTDSYDQNRQLYITEGLDWLKRKYGFKSRWSMQMYAKNFYDHFFTFNPDCIRFKV